MNTYKYIFRKKLKTKKLNIKKNNFLKTYGTCFWISKSYGYLTAKQIEATRRSVVRFVNKSGKFLINATTHLPLTQKSKATRMGKGKGKFLINVYPVKSGVKLFLLKGFNHLLSSNVLTKSCKKISILFK